MILTSALLATCLVFAPQETAPDTYQALASQYDQAFEAWKADRRPARKEGRKKEWEAANPTFSFYPRFEALEKAGESQALLWCAVHCSELDWKRARITEHKVTLYGRIVNDYQDQPWIVDAIARLGKERRWLGEDGVRAHLTTLFTAELPRSARAQAGAALAGRYSSRKEEERPRKLELLRKLATEFEDLPQGKQAGDQLYVLENLSIGAEAPGFVAKDVDGEQIELADYRGKVVVLDFWGFW